MSLDVLALVWADLERDFFGRPSLLSAELAGKPVLTRTLQRLARVEPLSRIAVAAPAEQMDRIRQLAGDVAFTPIHYTRKETPGWLAMRAARSFARHGWRGGVAGACVFDELFDPMLLPEIIDKTGADALALVHPGSALLAVEWVTDAVEWLIEHHRETRMAFDQAPPGLSAAVLTAGFVRDLAANGLFPGRGFVYNPRAVRPDPISQGFNRVLPQAAINTRRRILADTPRGLWVCRELIETLGDKIAGGVETCAAANALGPEPWPREVTVELTCRRPVTDELRPPGDRPDLSIDRLRELLAGLDEAGDVNVMLGGAGDALLHPDWPAAVAEARKVGAVALGTYGLNLPECAQALLDEPPEIVQVYIDAMTDSVYNAHKTGGSAERVWAHIKDFQAARDEAGQSLPMILPTMLKTLPALAEQDEFFDHSLLLTGWGVIREPTTAGDPWPGVVRMAPPRRRPCERIGERLTARSDGAVVACEEDLAMELTLPGDSLLAGWRSEELAELRRLHATRRWDARQSCAACQEFHRP